MWRRAVSTAALALLMVVLAGGPAEAARGGKGGSTPPPTTGSCYVTPNPVAVGAQYTIYGSGLQPGESLAVFAQDPHSTNVLFAITDSTGSFSARNYASWADTYTVSVYDNSGRTMVYLTGCSFSAV